MKMLTKKIVRPCAVLVLGMVLVSVADCSASLYGCFGPIERLCRDWNPTILVPCGLNGEQPRYVTATILNVDGSWNEYTSIPVVGRDTLDTIEVYCQFVIQYTCDGDTRVEAHYEPRTSYYIWGTDCGVC
jgi:hypothetical protein